MAQRSTAGAAPAASVVAAALSTGLATLDPSGSLVFAPPPTPTAPEPGVAASPSFAAPTVQREAEPAAASPPAPTTTTAASAPAPGPAGGGPQTEEQLEELARNLYDKIRSRLKAELRLDRERAGRVVDLAR